MEDEEKFDACMRLADFAAGRWDGRAQYEWRVTLGFWAVLVAALIYLKADQMPLSLGACVLALHGCWLRGVWYRHSADAEIAWHYFHEAQAILKSHRISVLPTRSDLRIGGSPIVLKLKRIHFGFAGFLFDWSLGFQLLCTAGLLALIYIVDANSITWLIGSNLTIKSSSAELPDL